VPASAETPKGRRPACPHPIPLSPRSPFCLFPLLTPALMFSFIPFSCLPPPSFSFSCFPLFFFSLGEQRDDNHRGPLAQKNPAHMLTDGPESLERASFGFVFYFSDHGSPAAFNERVAQIRSRPPRTNRGETFYQVSFRGPPSNSSVFFPPHRSHAPLVLLLLPFLNRLFI